MMKDRLLEILSAHVGKIFGSIMGLFLGWIIIAFGVLKCLFVALCIVIGFYLGSYLDSPKDSTNVTSRFLR